MDIADIKNIEDLQKAIEERAGVGMDTGEVPVSDFVGWFDKAFSRGKAIPFQGKRHLAVFAIFHDDAEVRVYSIQPAQPEQKTGDPPHRFSLSKAANVVVADILDIETFVDEIADELESLAGLEEPEPESKPTIDLHSDPNGSGDSPSP